MASYTWTVVSARMLSDGNTIRCSLQVVPSADPASSMNVDCDVLVTDTAAQKLTKARNAVQSVTLIGYSETINF